MKKLAIPTVAAALVAATFGLEASGLEDATASRALTARPSRIPIPAQTLRQIKAEYGQFTYVPSFIPRGFIFTSWRLEYVSRLNYERLELTFGRNGTLLVWTVSHGRDSDDYADCSKHAGDHFKRTISGRLVYYATGIHGDSAWTCFRARSRYGGRVPLGLDLWVENDIGRPSRAIAMRVVASLRRA